MRVEFASPWALERGRKEGCLHPTGMSIDRCIEALSSLHENLDRVLASPSSQSPQDQRDELEDLIRDLTLDIDLRTNVSNQAMTDVETTVYLPVIEKILALLALESPTFSAQQSVHREQAKELTKVAVMQANALRT